MKNYFDIVDTVSNFTLTGGEPLLHSQLHIILQEVLLYEKQIDSKVCIVTNGTLEMKSDLLKVLSSSDKFFIIISNYGDALSNKLDCLTSSLTQYDIKYRVEDYCENIKYGGWLDFRNHSLKHKTLEEVRSQAKSCIWKQGEYFDINFGELHACSRSFWRMYKGVIQKHEDQFINLNDPKLNITEAKASLCKIRQLIYLDSCAYCDGNREKSIRYRPAEQL